MAGSIKLFEFFQKFHQFVGIYPPQSLQSQRSANSAKTFLLFGNGQLILTTIAFLAFEATSIFEYGYAFYILLTVINSTIIFLIFIEQSHSTYDFIGHCEGFIKKRVYSTIAYQELIEKIELFNKLFCYAIYISIAILYLTALPYTIVRYCIFDMGTESYYLFSMCWYPFNWRTPSGYLVAWVAQYLGATSMSIGTIQFPNLAFGSCWLFIFIAEDITQDVVAFNIIANSETNKNRAELTKRFSAIVQIYSDAKECVMEFNKRHKYSLLLFFSWNMLGASSILVTLQFQLWAHDSSLLEIASSFCVLFWMTIFIFLLCEPGARMINQFNLLCEEFSRCDWYLLSIKMQQMYVVFLSDTQKPIKITSFANITCERETSKQMINKAFSYFMTIRRFRI